MGRLGKISLVFIVGLVVSSFKCKQESGDCHKSIKVINNTADAIYIGFTTAAFPDTLFSNAVPNPALQPAAKKIKAGEQNNTAISVVHGGQCIEDATNIMVYVFDATVLETIPWDTVKAKNSYVKRYDLTLQQIKDRNWVIAYP
jgi:hypothetical protein